MRMIFAAAVGLTLAGTASAQPWGGREYGYRDRGYGFDESEYLRCNPDVRRAVMRGQMESGSTHYQVFGRREGRRLSC